ncbi:MAG: hypothetical protein DME50_01465 [Verrucomicrobia bacterium]|nr:MAG: hypothetical protein DME50_01465 [Verrucomicrobiota bacterium]
MVRASKIVAALSIPNIPFRVFCLIGVSLLPADWTVASVFVRVAPSSHLRGYLDSDYSFFLSSIVKLLKRRLGSAGRPFGNPLNGSSDEQTWFTKMSVWPHRRGRLCSRL